MPELPEVETTVQGIKPHLEGQVICGIIVRNSKLRIPITLDINTEVSGKYIKSLTRKAKYIILNLSEGFIIIHLEMSDHLRLVQYAKQHGAHDHVDLILGNDYTLRFCDPRRFGLFFYTPNDPEQHSLFTRLGPEPLTQNFNANYLFQKTRNKNQAIKSFIMDNKIVVGIGNIYATESLFLAKIHPQEPAKNLTMQDCELLTAQIKTVLNQAIEAGGTTLRDFYKTDGKPGYFSNFLQVYGRKNQLCFQCNTLIQSLFIAGRNTAFCPCCQMNQSRQ